MSLQFALRGVEGVTGTMERLAVEAAKLDGAVELQRVALARTVQKIYAEHVHDAAPVGKSTYTDKSGGQHPGHLRDSIKGRIESVPGGIAVVFWSTAAYARFVLEGTRAHTIVPRQARVLAFHGKTGEMVFVREVHHPGTKPNPFNERAWQASLPAVNAALTVAGREILVSFHL